MKRIKITLLALLTLATVSCEKENPEPNSGIQTPGQDCKCGIVISREYDPYFSNGYAQNRYDVKARNECSNNIKEFTLIPDNGDAIPEEGAYWCNSTEW